MNFVQHFKAFCLLLVFYYVGMNSQKKSKKSKKHGITVLKSNKVNESEEGKDDHAEGDDYLDTDYL